MQQVQDIRVQELGTIDDGPKLVGDGIAETNTLERPSVRHSHFGGFVAAAFFLLVGVLLTRSLRKKAEKQRREVQDNVWGM